MLTDPYPLMDSAGNITNPREDEIREIEAALTNVLVAHKCTYSEAESVLRGFIEHLAGKNGQRLIEDK